MVYAALAARRGRHREYVLLRFGPATAAHRTGGYLSEMWDDSRDHIKFTSKRLTGEDRSGKLPVRTARAAAQTAAKPHLSVMRAAYMLLATQAFSSLFGAAPTLVATGFPPLNRIIVGMPRTP